MNAAGGAHANAYLDYYRGRRVMITGGVGFIGSNLAHRLADLGADILLVDSLIPEYGGNLYNIHGIADRVRLNIADVRMQTTMEALVRDRDVIFNLAGQVSHIDSMRDRTPIWRSTAARSSLFSRRAGSTGTGGSSSPGRARSTAVRTTFLSTKSTWSAPQDING